MEKRKWGTFTKFWFGLSITAGVLVLAGGVMAFMGLLSYRGNPNLNTALYNKALIMMGAGIVIVVLGLAAMIWLIKSKTPKALYSVIGLSVLNVIISLVSGQMPQAVGGVIGAVIIWLLCRKVVFDLE